MIKDKSIREVLKKYENELFYAWQNNIDIKEIRKIWEQEIIETILARFPEKMECDRHKSAMDTPRGVQYCVTCYGIDCRNQAIDQCRKAVKG